MFLPINTFFEFIIIAENLSERNEFAEGIMDITPKDQLTYSISFDCI